MIAMYMWSLNPAVFLSSASFSSFGSLCKLAFHQLTSPTHPDKLKQTTHESTVKKKKPITFPMPIVTGNWRIMLCYLFPNWLYLHSWIICTPVRLLEWFGCTNSMGEVTDIYTVKKRIHHKEKLSCFCGLISTPQCQCLGDWLAQHLDWIGI